MDHQIKNQLDKEKKGSTHEKKLYFLRCYRVSLEQATSFTSNGTRVFPQELKTLSSGTLVHSSSKIASLHPVFHNGLIKAGGRIRHANIPKKSKHQVILLKYHHTLN